MLKSVLEISVKSRNIVLENGKNDEFYYLKVKRLFNLM